MRVRKPNCKQCDYHYRDGVMDGMKKMYSQIDKAVRKVWESSNHIDIRESLKSKGPQKLTRDKLRLQSLCKSCTKPDCDVNFHDWEVTVSECSKWGNK